MDDFYFCLLICFLQLHFFLFHIFIFLLLHLVLFLLSHLVDYTSYVVPMMKLTYSEFFLFLYSMWYKPPEWASISSLAHNKQDSHTARSAICSPNPFMHNDVGHTHGTNA